MTTKGKAAAKKGKPKKTPQKSPRPSNGGLLLTGNPGNRGGTGRPPDEFKARMRELATKAEVESALESVLSDRNDPNWLGALKYATEHGYGKAKEHVQVDVNTDVATALEAARQRAKNR